MWLLLAAQSFAGPIDRVLFVVGERIVTQSDVAFELFFDLHDHSPVPSLEDPTLPLADRLRDVAVVRQLAGEASVFRPSNAEVRARADAFVATWSRADDGLVALEGWGLDEQTFMGFVYSRMVVERCIARSVALPQHPEDAGEVGAWFEKYRAWIEPLRQRADVRQPVETE